MDTSIVTLGFSHMGVGLLFLLIGWFLKNNKMPRNRFVGVRIQQSLASDEAWYAINAFGGKKLIVCGGILVFTGIALFGLQPHFPYEHLILGLFFPLLVVTYLVIAIFRFAAKNFPR